jgi:hypothetical protein
VVCRQDLERETSGGRATVGCEDGQGRELSLLAQRARSECARWTRALESIPVLPKLFGEWR